MTTPANYSAYAYLGMFRIQPELASANRQRPGLLKSAGADLESEEAGLESAGAGFHPHNSSASPDPKSRRRRRKLCNSPRQNSATSPAKFCKAVEKFLQDRWEILARLSTWCFCVTCHFSLAPLSPAHNRKVVKICVNSYADVSWPGRCCK